MTRDEWFIFFDSIANCPVRDCDECKSVIGPGNELCPQSLLREVHREDFERIAKMLENTTEITDDELVNLLVEPSE